MWRAHHLSLILFLVAPACLVSCFNPPEAQKKNINNFHDLTSVFAHPPAKYSTAPFWVWNDKITFDQIDRQLADYRDHGIFQLIIHPRPGLITEYLSDDWFSLVKHTVEKAKVLGMLIWLYDENSYPSGFAGGHVLAMMPPGYDPVVGLKLIRLSRLEKSDRTQYYLILKESGNSFTDITYSVSRYYGKTGRYYGFMKWYYPEHEGMFAGGSYVDLLAYGITERFLRVTMKGYEKNIGSEFGKTVPGIFTDEPHISPEGDSSVIRFTPALFSGFEEKYGYRLENYLPALYEETGDWKNVRHDYYSFLLDRFIQRWSQPWNRYTDSMHLNWTGHYWDHAWPNPRFGGDNMAMYEWHQYPGVDLLFNNEVSRPDQFGNIRIVKELSSVANQLGKERTLSETYGGSGWELGFEDMKRNGDWEYALGVNLMNQHLSYMTIQGARKRDFPQSFSYHAPWWKDYDLLSGYFQRLSLALSSGQQINKILVMEPTTTAWMYYTPDQQGDHHFEKGKLKLISGSFRELLETLEKNQFEYDLGCENIMANHGSVKGHQLNVGERSYNLVILPPYFENMENRVYKLILEYLKAGGKVISMSSFPDHLDGNDTRTMSKTLENAGLNWLNIGALNDLGYKSLTADSGFQPLDPLVWGGRVFHQRRIFDDGSLLFFANYDTLTPANLHFRVKGKEVIELDAISGAVKGFPGSPAGDHLDIHFTLEPSGSKLLFISENQPGYKIPEPVDFNREVKTSPVKITRLQPNSLALDYCDLSVAGKNLKDLYFYNAADTVFKFYLKNIYGFNYNPWSVAVQYRTEILDKNNFDSVSGFAVTFPFVLAENFKPDSLMAVIERPGLYTVSLNGNIVQPIRDRWWLDRSFGVFDIRPYLKEGRNLISYSIHPMNVLAEIEPVYLLGPFKVRNALKGWEIMPETPLSLGSWKDQGLPFYSFDISYSHTIVAKSGKKYLVRLDKWKGTLAEVKVNGVKAGVIGWPPYGLDISEYIKSGTNSIDVTVTGSLKNQLGPHHNHPLKGMVTPWSFFFAPLHQPPASEYDLLNYGLFSDFKVLTE